MAGPLTHIRVLDLTRVLAGPWCAQNLADLGAEVIKVERPKKGDDSRAFGPPWAKDENGKETTEAGYYLCANRGKKSITIDIASEAGAALVKDLARSADVFLENFKVGDLASKGLGYEDLKAINPGIIYCSITGFGQTGPYAPKPGYDFMIQGMGGFMSVTGERDNKPGGGPQRAGVPVVDIMTGMYSTIAVCAAIANRERTGKGQHIDMALLDTQIGFLANQGANYLVTGEPPVRLGNTHPNIVPYQSVPTRDGAVIIACGNDNLFNKLCDLLGQPALKTDARFATNAARVANRDALDPILDELMRKRTTAEWVPALEAAGVPCGPINNLKEVFEDPHVVARGIKVEIPHPTAGKVALVRSPMRFSETPIEYNTPPPLLGQHTDEVLKSVLGKSADEIAALRKSGAV
ncbi:MAG: CaiB/BaiF CoA-transferase family protein [Hyphomicrobiaceae bacterium]|nr:CaiB/BaiF CoA-transferase family protein [Hyphomicrobiaceae bacterium]